MANVLSPTSLKSIAVQGLTNLDQERVNSAIGDVPIVFNPTSLGCCMICCCCCPFNSIKMPDIDMYAGLINTHGRYSGMMKSGQSKNFGQGKDLSHAIYLGTSTYNLFVKSVAFGSDSSGETGEVCGMCDFYIKSDEKSLYNFVYKLGPRGLQEMLSSFIEEMIREKAKELNAETKGKLKDLNVETMIEANEHFQQFGVVISKFTVVDIA